MGRTTVTLLREAGGEAQLFICIIVDTTGLWKICPHYFRRHWERWAHVDPRSKLIASGVRAPELALWQALEILLDAFLH